MLLRWQSALHIAHRTLRIALGKVLLHKKERTFCFTICSLFLLMIAFYPDTDSAGATGHGAAGQGVTGHSIVRQGTV